MNLAFVTEARFVRDGSGNVYCDPAFDLRLWDRYLNSFENVYVIARVKFDPNYKGQQEFISNSDKVRFIDLPYYIGPIGYLRKYFAMRRTIKVHVESLRECRFILRVPGPLGALVASVLSKKGRSYGLEVVGDPAAVFSSGSFRRGASALYRYVAVAQLRRTIRHASAIQYVTQSMLQSLYPAPDGVFSIGVSDVRLLDEDISNEPKRWVRKPCFEVVSVGSLAQMYKAPDVVLRAFSMIRSGGSRARFCLTWLGDGVYKSAMEALARNLGISDRVKFLGNVSAPDVHEALRRADMFVLASRTEGLPRAVVEAMAKGLPIVGTRVGGIPELLDEQVLVSPDDSEALVKKVLELFEVEDFYNQQAARNLSFAKAFRYSELVKKNEEFYIHVRDFCN